MPKIRYIGLISVGVLMALSARAAGPSGSSPTTGAVPRPAVTASGSQPPAPGAPRRAPVAPKTGKKVSVSRSSAVQRALKLLVPFDLASTNNPSTCAGHTGSLDECKEAIVLKKLILRWSFAFCPDRNCAKRIDGFRIYEVPKGWKPSLPPPPDVQLAQHSLSGPAQTSAMAAQSGVTVSAPVNVDPRKLVATVFAPKGGAIITAVALAATATRGKCFSVAAYLGQSESANSDPYCVPKDAPTGTTKLTLKPSALASGYWASYRCTAKPPVTHPSGSVVIGEKKDAKGMPCQHYEGLVRFDVMKLGAPFISKATLVFAKVANYRRDGTILQNGDEGICFSDVHATKTNWAAGVTDPRQGQTQLGDRFGSQADFYSHDVTAAVNASLKGGANNGFVITGRVVQGFNAHCVSSIGSLELVVETFDNK